MFMTHPKAQYNSRYYSSSRLHKLYAEGNTIVYWTDRGSKECSIKSCVKN